MVAVDPLKRVFPQQAGVDVPQQDGHIGVPHLLRQLFFVEKVHIDELRVGEHLPQRVHILFVVPDGRNDLVDFWHSGWLLSV